MAGTTYLRAKSIAIVGAGPSGVAAAKYLIAEKAFDRITLFEQRAKAGGIWNHTDHQHDEDIFQIPQTDPRGKNQDPIWQSKPYKVSSIDATSSIPISQPKASFISPIYDDLETNNPRPLMQFTGQKWPPNTPLYPRHETVRAHVEAYGEDVQHLVQYETQVVNVDPVNGSDWKVTVRNLHSNNQSTEIFNAVIVANGHFIVPQIPDIPGIREWNERYPGSITHSKYYRRASDFAGKKVIVVGSSASGSDISLQICQSSQKPLLWSCRSPPPAMMTTPLRRELPPISKFIAADRSVEFEDGTVEKDIDAILFATGYLYSLPFLENLQPKLITDGSHVNHTYQHLIYTPRPTLSFLVLNQRVTPFIVAEAQSAVLARILSGRLPLPEKTAMEEWERKTLSETSVPRNFHLLPTPKDAQYMNDMSNWALSALPREGLENEGKGKIPPRWGEYEFWCRENFPAIRKAFMEFGEERLKVIELADVGFGYDDFLKHKGSRL
ncbi:FAD/NAD(P)-binding domain-containing protein [Periconia macrospinosa]|uniref:FAD/NAD(P)-binding domain-containing protein n=1 Tax=Periconia macrospinosa TaxID=97972 RepID=A0A2V1DME4_9PLEO|nr:FAD/NAD(P)-binding domain-containing protein [Periconia macrospinosa]